MEQAAAQACQGGTLQVDCGLGGQKAPILQVSRNKRRMPKAVWEEMLDTFAGDKKDSEKEVAGASKYLASVHGECDWRMKYFVMEEIEKANGGHRVGYEVGSGHG